MTQRLNFIFEITTLIFGAYCLAAAANSMLAPNSISSNLQIGGAAQTAPRSIPAFTSFNTILARNLFQIFDPQSIKAPPPPPTKLTDISVASVKAKLLGTIYSNTPPLRRAIVSEGGPQRIVKKGDAIQGLKILEIQRRALVLDKAGKRELLLIDKNDAAVAEKAKRNHNISRTWIKSQIKNIAQIAREIHLKPADYGNGNIGVLVQHLDPKSQLNRLGLQMGDLILTANGKKTTSFRNPFEAFRLLDSPKLTLNILRRGKKQTLTYNLAK